MAAKKILMLVGDYVEDYEVMVPFQALIMVGHSVQPEWSSSTNARMRLASRIKSLLFPSELQ
jgi:hypothetical protein